MIVIQSYVRRWIVRERVRALKRGSDEMREKAIAIHSHIRHFAQAHSHFLPFPLLLLSHTHTHTHSYTSMSFLTERRLLTSPLQREEQYIQSLQLAIDILAAFMESERGEKIRHKTLTRMSSARDVRNRSVSLNNAKYAEISGLPMVPSSRRGRKRERENRERTH